MARRASAGIPRYKRQRQRRSLPARIFWFLVKLVVGFILFSLVWVLAYRFINPPVTATMVGDMVAGRGAARDWMSIDEIDRDMVRAVIAAEDSKFCQHKGFDLDAIQDAMRRNASGGRIRGGSTISQQTAKNAFLWQGGGYVRKGLEAWFTMLMEATWPKRRIIEVYLNIAETGIGTYGVNAGAQRYYDHDASAMSRTEAARIAAVLPLPKERGAVAPKGFTRRYGNSITARIAVVGRDGLDSCVYEGMTAPRDKAPPASSRPRVQPGEEYETARPAPPLQEVFNELPPVSTEPLLNEAAPDAPQTSLQTPPQPSEDGGEANEPPANEAAPVQ